MTLLSGIHPVREALRAGRPLERVLVARGAGGPRLQEIVELCRERGVPVRFEPRSVLDRLAPEAAHQGVVASASAARYADFDQVAAEARLLVGLDGVEDPHNLGAIARTACAAGAGGLILPDRRSAGLTETAAKAAAGALEHLPVVRVGNLNRAIEKLKERGFWIYGLDERGPHLYTAIDYAQPALLVLGGEGRGLRQLVAAKCDLLVRIPTVGPIPSLNVSVAAGIVLFEWRRRLSS